MRRVTRYIAQLLRDRRPRPFVPTDEESAAIRTAIQLRAARPESAIPRPEFIAELRDRLAEEAGKADETVTVEEVPLRRRPRRGLLIGTVTAAGAAAVGATADRLIGGRGTLREPVADSTVEPADGTWKNIMASEELAEGQVAAFDTGTVSGFVTRDGNTLSARSGVCTHQGCRLSFNAGQRRLDCPCHHTFFGLDGKVISSQLPTRPARLPAFAVREREGKVQLYVPPPTAG
jgi:nitrite reductase/ring-hydroxylating ferredoxin subunit